MRRAIGVLLLVPAGAFLAEAAAAGAWEPAPAAAWGRTLALAATATGLALAFGVPAGLALANGGSRAGAALVLMPLLVPPVLGAAAWMALKAPQPGPVACGAILAAHLWPVPALLVSAAARAIPRAPLEAAELHLEARRALTRVVWPAVRPSVAASAVAVFALAAADFTVPATFAVTTASHVIYERLSSFDFGGAAFAAAPLAAAAGAAGWALGRVPVVAGSGPGRRFLGAGAARAAACVAGAAWVATAAAPAAMFAARAGSPAAFVRVLGTHAESFAWTLGVAAVAAAGLALWASMSAGRSRLEPFWAAGLALPGVAAALGALSIAGRLGVQRPLVESGALLAFALASRFAVVAWLPLRGAVERSQLEAAELARLGGTWRKVAWPAVRGRAVAAGAIVFALALGEIGPGVLLSPPGRQTVVQHLFNWMHYGYDETVASLALALMAGAALVAWTATHGRRLDTAAVGR